MDLSRAEKRQINRQHLWSVMHDGQGPAGHAFNFTLILLILLSVAIIPLEFLSDVQEFAFIGHVIEAVVIGLFTLEYGMRIYAAPNRLRYLFSFYGLVDFFSVVPFYAGFFGSEYIRLIHLVRLLKLTEIEPAASSDSMLTMQKGIGLAGGEKVEYVVTKSPVVLFIGVLPPIVSVAFGLGLLLSIETYSAIALSSTLFFFALVFAWKAWLDYSYDVIYVTNYRLIFQNQHILGRSINQVNYPAITNVKPFYPNVLSFIFRYGSLIIDTAAEHPGQIGLHTVSHHEQAAHVIMRKCYEVQAAVAGVESSSSLLRGDTAAG